MTYIKRDLENKILSLSKEYSCILITGPRQVGKTTVLKQLAAANRTYVSLDDLEERKIAQTDPALFCSRPLFSTIPQSFRKFSNSFHHGTVTL